MKFPGCRGFLSELTREIRVKIPSPCRQQSRLPTAFCDCRKIKVRLNRSQTINHWPGKMINTPLYLKTKNCLLYVVIGLIAGFHPVLAQPALGIAPAGNLSVLFWPTNDSTYVLQSTTNLNSTNWTAVTDAVPVIAFTVTNVSPTRFFRLYQSPIPSGMAIIPPGPFIMGNVIGDSDITDAAPVVVTASGFYMDTNLVSYSQWLTVYNWATNSGYGFVNAGAFKVANHPVQTVDWYDVVKWCNARSQLAGFTPVYYTDAGMVEVYTNGETDAVYARWTANGYRLPTEAEWEKAARGGLNGQRFPLGNTISESQANYQGFTFVFNYDLGPNGYNATYAVGGFPYTSPAGSFPANGYGLYDMAGNVFEWCWDWYGAVYAGGSDPRGPTSGSDRIFRGGDWGESADQARCAARGYIAPDYSVIGIGFRCVKGL
ncbi:MAG TPA: SUMF1/EgtB/PvdO family nonheme iron enzyme [Verrucomicrobiae bacterium]|jgi:formylglycine-generating enzyme required for sulfatase activity